jgi:sulfite reductase alpha subunit-like flavoprotein
MEAPPSEPPELDAACVSHVLSFVDDAATIGAALRVCRLWRRCARDNRLPVWAEPGALRLPPDPSVPLIMVGPGTGVAPFRAFLQKRAALRRAGGAAPAPCVLFFGCRHEAGDYLYRAEWGALEAEGLLAAGGLVAAFSRDQASKVYVQHRIRERGAELWRLLEQGARRGGGAPSH